MRGPEQRTRWMVGVALLLVMVLPSLAGADSLAGLSATLPTPRWGTAAISDGQYSYIFGGEGAEGALDEIVRFDPSTGQVTVVNARLAGPMAFMSAAWDPVGQRAYIFGGWNPGQGDISVIQVFDPASDTLSNAQAWLPKPLNGAAAAWLGDSAYIFGGQSGVCCESSVYRFMPGQAGPLPLVAAFTKNRAAASAVSDGQSIYVLGGFQGNAGSLDEVVRFDPPGLLTVLPVKLPLPEDGISAVWTGKAILLFTNALFRGDVWEVDPVAGWAETKTPKLSLTRFWTSATWHEGHAYVFGGRHMNSFAATIDDYLVRRPGPPNFFEVESEDADSARISWSPPSDNGGRPIGGYKVYRDDGTGWKELVSLIGEHQDLWFDDGLESLHRYHYRVAAYHADGAGEPTESQCLRPSPLPDQLLHCDSII